MCLQANLKPKDWLYVLLWGCYSIWGWTYVMQVIKRILLVLNVQTHRWNFFVAIPLWALMFFSFIPFSSFSKLGRGVANFHFLDKFHCPVSFYYAQFLWGFDLKKVPLLYRFRKVSPTHFYYQNPSLSKVRHRRVCVFPPC